MATKETQHDTTWPKPISQAEQGHYVQLEGHAEKKHMMQTMDTCTN
jgi:hypothetical protein